MVLPCLNPQGFSGPAPVYLALVDLGAAGPGGGHEFLELVRLDRLVHFCVHIWFGQRDSKLLIAGGKGRCYVASNLPFLSI